MNLFFNSVKNFNFFITQTILDNNINFIAAIDIPDNPVILKEKIRNDSFLILKGLNVILDFNLNNG